MKNKSEQFERLHRICEKLESFGGRKISLKEFAQLFNVSERTIQNDITLLREEYLAPIDYDFKERGYYFTEPFSFRGEIGLKPQDVSALKIAVATLSQYKQKGLFENLEILLYKVEKAIHFKPNKETGKYDFIEFESVPFFAGSQWLDFFIQAIQYKKCVAFSYQKFQDETPSQRLLHPYFLKEHRNRWYVIGLEEKSKAMRMFGLDRISKLRPDEVLQYQPNQLDLVQMFRYSYGIFIDFKSKPEEVVLSFTPDRAKYLKSQPFHEQQLDTKHILADNAKEFRVRFEFIINQELVMELARLGKDVKILAPESLRKEVELHHQQALQK